MVSQRVRQFIMENDHFARHLSIELLEVRDGYARARMPLGPEHRNGVGLAHGGAIFALMDLAFAAAANADGQVALNLNSSISFLTPGRQGPLFATAQRVHTTRRIGSYDIRVADAEGTLLAICQATAYRTGNEVPGTVAALGGETDAETQD